MSRNILLISPYHTGSHRAWAEGYARHSRHNVHLISMAGRFWKWRMQGGAIEMALQIKRWGQENGRADAVLVTDMVNLPALIALARPWLDSTPILYYAHENQLSYPPPPGEKRDLTYGMINTLSMLCADKIAFNSAYHRHAFFEELPRLLKHFPDYNHLEIIPALKDKCVVLPVGLELASLAPPSPAWQPTPGPLRILWNQRWEYDKNPAAFFAAMLRLQASGASFQMIVVGENFRQRPAEFEYARQHLADHLLHFGYLPDRASYVRRLWQADVVVSTAIHEFFGISVLEAIYCGCYPLLPRRLSYPELLPESYHPQHLTDSADELVARLLWATEHVSAVRQQTMQHVAAAYGWERLAPLYDQHLQVLM
ncbi:MAG: DUF3524 domain-containing protein [Chloroflexi bacterium]|nr:DUF3524 domain-containing protein [Chloroflexota bacterium]